MAKKYLYNFMAILFAAISFSFASCVSDDEEESGGSDYVAEVITIGGSLKYYNSTQQTRDYSHSYVDTYSEGVKRFRINLYNYTEAVKDFGDAYIWIDVPSTSIKNGKDITNDIKTMTVHLPAHNDDYTYVGGMFGKTFVVKNGKIQISKLTSEYVTVKFDKVTVELGGQALKIEGEASCEVH